jgi:hypothetical protein
MGGQYVDGGWYEQCENDTYSGDPHAGAAGAVNIHYVFHKNGAYRIICDGENYAKHNGELAIRCKIDGCGCRTLFALMVGALEREAVEGTLDPEEWAGTFRRRTGELVAMSKERAAAALADDLPPVLSGIVSAYLW